jgi:hypothetical protein
MENLVELVYQSFEKIERFLKAKSINNISIRKIYNTFLKTWNIDIIIDEINTQLGIEYSKELMQIKERIIKMSPKI